MLAVNGLFILVTKHGLEYPDFYSRLYGLLSLDAFQVCGMAERWHCSTVFSAIEILCTSMA